MTASPADIQVAIAHYQAAQEERSGESAAKIEAIHELEPYLAHPHAEAFLASVLRNPSEYDLARVEICRALHAWSSGPLGERYADALLAILQSDDDILVRQWAANALARCHDRPQVVHALVAIAAESTEDPDVRHNAVASLRGASIANAERVLLQRVASDPEVGSSITNLLRAMAP